MSAQPAARVGDDIAHSHAGMGLITGLVVGGVVAGAILLTGGLALVPLAGAATALSVGGLGGAYIGGGSMGEPCGTFVTGSPNVFINGRPATMTAFSFATCSKESGGPIPLATGSSTVMINGGLAGREGEKLGCSALSVKQTSPDVFIGGDSAADPRVSITPEVPAWATTALTVLGIAGAVMLLPEAIATVGLAATIGGGVAGYFGGKYGAEGGRALGEALGLPEAGVRSLEVAGGLLGGTVAGAAGTRGVQGFNSRYQIKVDPSALGMNGGNVSLVRRPPATARSPFQTRYDPLHPGGPDPNWSVDTRNFDPNASTATRTATGEIRDQNQFWGEWSQRHPETLSPTNQDRINKAGLSPQVDDTWAETYPEHGGYNGQTLEHHHYNRGPIAIPLPREVHRGTGNYNVWHGHGP